MALKSEEKEDPSKPNPFRRVDLRVEIERLNGMLDELKVLHEQHFMGILPLLPDKQHNEFKRQLRLLRKAPFKNSEMIYRMRMLESRYGTLYTYWMRVLREKEEGTYYKDVFKAELREKQAQAEAFSQTAEGKVEKGFQGLFDAYKNALEKQTGQKANLDYSAFQKALIQRAKDFKAKTGVDRLAFKIIVKDGKVTVQAKAKE